MIQTYAPLQIDIYENKHRCHYLFLPERNFFLVFGVILNDGSCVSVEAFRKSGRVNQELIRGFTFHNLKGDCICQAGFVIGNPLPSAAILNGFDIRDEKGQSLKGEWVKRDVSFPI